jgi:hypothetical protein
VSVKLDVYLKDERLPTHAQWQKAIKDAGFALILEEIDTRTHSGFVPARLGDQECGFEYDFYPLDVAELEEDAEMVGNRDGVVRFTTHGGAPADLLAAMLAAGVLTKCFDGVFQDQQSGEFATGDGVFDKMKRDEAAKWERGKRSAWKDGHLTDRRCPQCGCPLPSYRKTCKGCGFKAT